MKPTLLSALLLLTTLAYAQPNRWWHIGQNLRLDVNSDPPIVTNGGCLNTPEGVASISSVAGNFLFATDGLNVYNSSCAIMPNGAGLLGGTSSTQSGIIVQNPTNANIYYIFTAAQDIGAAGINYSIVDMTLNSGTGAVTTKNFSLTPFVMSEKLTAVRHCNNVDVWVIAKRFNDPGFRTWLVTSAGVNPVPVISSAGYSPTGINQASYGQLKANPQGNKLLAAYYGLPPNSGGNRAEIYDFDNSTGIVSNATNLGFILGAYGAEWSPDGTIAYVCTNQGLLLQYSLCNSTLTQIANTGPFLGSMQLTPQGKILIAKGTASRLACIQNPNNLGLACNFTDNYLTLPAQSRFGLPNFASYYFNPPTPMFTYSQVDCNSFQLQPPPFASGCGQPLPPSISWNYLSATTITSSPVINLPSGSHPVTLSLTYACRTETQTQTLTSSSLTGIVSGW